MSAKKTIIMSIGEIKQQLHDSPIAHKIATGAFWSFVGTVVASMLGLLSSIIIARILGKNAFGEYGVIQSTIGMFGLLAGFGLGQTATKYIAEFRYSDIHKTGRIIGMSYVFSLITATIISLLLVLMAPYLAAKTLAAPHMTNVLRVSSIMLFISALNGAQNGAICGFSAFRAIAKINLISGLFSFPIMIVFTYNFGLIGTIWGMIITMSVNWCLSHIALKHEMKNFGIAVNIKNCSQELAILWQFSFPSVLVGLVVGPANWVCNAMLVNTPNGYAEMGVYNAANQWRNALSFLPNILSPVILTTLVESRGDQNKSQIKKSVTIALVFSLIAILLPTLILLALSPLIVKLYGQNYQVPISLFVLIMIVTALSNIGSSLYVCLQSINKIWIGLAGNILWAITIIVLFYLMLPYKAIGYATANLISYFITIIIIAVPIYNKLYKNNKCEVK